MIRDEKYVSIAVNLARMYGVAETLNPVSFMSAEDFDKMIEEWTNEYLLQDRSDIVVYFEAKMKLL